MFGRVGAEPSAVVCMVCAVAAAAVQGSTASHAWHVHAPCCKQRAPCWHAVTTPLSCRYPDYYKRNRHRIIVGQRLLRLTGMLLAVYQSSSGLQAALARAMDVRATAAVTTTGRLRSAVLNLTRPLFLAPVLTAAHVSAGSGVQLWGRWRHFRA
jgi:hypothetical protein